MNKALFLASSLARIPRLFVHLLLWPLVISFVLVYVQLFVTGLYLGALREKSEGSADAQPRQEYQQEVLRFLLYGSKDSLAHYTVCRWVDSSNENQKGLEVPPSLGCMPNKFDVAIRVSNPATFDPTSFETALRLDGNIERLHICRTCHPDLVFDATKKDRETHIYSIWGGLLLALVEMHQDIAKSYSIASTTRKAVEEIVGETFLHSKGFRNAINTKEIFLSIAILFNIALLIVLTLWLAIRAHRKILDYFSKSGALLPLVASTGKGTFYGAVWFLTSFRVIAFLIGSVPLTVISLRSFIKEEEFDGFFKGDLPAFAVWVLGLLVSFALATMLASVAELKSRHGALSFLYRYFPLFVCAIGSLVWAITFLQETASAGSLRAIITSLPVVGMGPMLVSPIFPPAFEAMVINTLLTTIFVIVTIKRNSRWFAAHLEEL